MTGIGSAMLFVPLSIAVGATTPEEGPIAAAFINLSTQLGGAVSIALLDVFIDRWSFHSESLRSSATLAAPSTQHFLARSGPVQALALQINAQAVVLAYADAMLAIGLVCRLCAPLVLTNEKATKALRPCRNRPITTDNNPVARAMLPRSRPEITRKPTLRRSHAR